MKILAVDTSSAAATVALTDGKTILGEYTQNNGKTHSQKLVPLIERILMDIGLEPGDIDLFAAASGPGSFTGLRIGITTVKAIAYAVGKPVAGIPTLDALAFNIPPVSFTIPAVSTIICPIMDARNGQVYTALYRHAGIDGEILQDRITDYMGIHVSTLVQMLKGTQYSGYDIVFTGDAVRIHKEYLSSELEDRSIFARENLLIHRASSVAYLAFLKASSGAVESCFDLKPFYLRKSQAEREIDEKAARDNEKKV